MPRRAIRPYTKSWQVNASTSLGTNAGIDYSPYSRLIVDFWYLRNGAQASPGGVVIESSANPSAVNDAWSVFISTAGQIQLFYHDASGTALWSSAVIPINRWVHLVCVFDKNLAVASSVKTYVDSVISGAITAATAASGGVFGNYVLNTFFRSGVAAMGPNGSKLKDLRIHTKSSTVTAQDVIDIYNNAPPATMTKLNHWMGEDTGGTPGTAVDQGTLGKNLTITSTLFSPEVPTSYRHAIVPITKSIFFDRVSDYIGIGNNFAVARTDPFSFSQDVLWDGTNALMLINGKLDPVGASPGYWLEMNRTVAGGLRLVVSSNYITAAAIAGPTTYRLPIGKYVNIIATYDGSGTAAGIGMFVNGVSVAMTSIQDSLGAGSLATTANYNIGAYGNGSSPWGGNITNARLHDAALTQQEAINLHFLNIATHVRAEWDWSNASAITLPALVGGVAGSISGAITSTAVPPYFGSRSAAGTRSAASSRTVVS